MSEEFEKLIIERFDRIDKRLDGIDTRLEVVEKRLDGVDTRLEVVNKRLDGVDTRLEVVDTSLSVVYTRLDEVGKRLDDMYKVFDERINSMSETLVLLEHKMTTEFPSLYEIYSLNYQFQKENEEEIKSLENTVNKHSIQISDLYNTIKKSS